MRPAAVLIAIVFGSAAAISFGLIATSVVFAVLRNDEPRLAQELPALLASCVWFLGLAAVSGAALYATLKELRWRAAAQWALGLALLVVAWMYWPKG